MEQNISIQEYYKTILYLYRLKNTLNFLVAVLKFIRENLRKFQREVVEI